jgi:phosphohistidine phosphatase SixA
MLWTSLRCEHALAELAEQFKAAVTMITGLKPGAQNKNIAAQLTALSKSISVFSHRPEKTQHNTGRCRGRV